MYSQVNEKTLLFKTITTEHGLSNNVIYDILQDKDGYIWFGTDNGLNKFDGYIVKKFFNIPNSEEGLSSSVVRSIIEDNSGNLWVGTKNGLNLYNRAENKFSQITVFDRSKIMNLEIMNMSLDKEGNIWMNTLNDIIYFNSKTHEYKVVYSSVLTPFMVIIKGKMYYKNDNGDFYSYDTKNNKSEQIFNDTNLIRKYLDYGKRSKSLWLPKHVNKSIDSIRVNYLPVLPDNPEPNSLIELNDHSIWLGTNQGLFEYNYKGKSLQKIKLGTSALSNQIRSLYKDNFGGIWVGTLSGVMHYDINRKHFRHKQLEAEDAENIIMGLYSSQSGIFANTFGNGIHFISNNSEVSKRLVFPEAIKNHVKYVWDIEEIPESKLPIWLATNNGLVCFNPIDLKFDMIELPIQELDKNISFSILNTKDNFIWISSYRAIHQVNKSNGDVVKSFPLNEFMEHSGIQKLETLGNYIFIATEGEGLLALDKTTHKTIKVKVASQNDLPQQFEAPIWDLLADNDTLWIGSNQGLYKLTLDDLMITPVLEDNQVVFSIIKDDDGHFWMGSDTGIKLYNPTHKISRYFTNKNGLKNLEFNRKSAIKTQDGDLWFGGTNGITKFIPKNIKKENPNTPFVHITKLKAVASDSSIIYTDFEKPITLPWKYNTIEISYVGLNFTNSSQNTYKYKMAGYDPDWVVNNQPIAARYVKLPFGSYEFNVTSANNDGLYNSNGKTITIKIKPPFWRTNTAYVIYILSIIGLFKLFQSLKKYRTRIKEVEKEKYQIAKKVERVSIILNNKSKIYLDQLVYIKSDGNYLEFITEGKTIIDRNKLKDVLEELPPNFVRVHRSYVVNKNHIKSQNSTSVVLHPNFEIPISRTFKSNIEKH
ncbi:two-component regulator propeller domain-containing protein [Winogradskyella sp.]|uniref:ligand-binding sensor domain-containing protein n=1 Tax=Winogradskyella sp. TaxID=1883156 RepID=UPI0025E6B046|nr:two-component regulator propeller domain-containing protein [Winogradskyella sp.]